MTTVESARKFEELLGGKAAASPYEYASLFKTDGFTARQRSKARFKLLKVLDFKLRHILDRGEKVLFITTGTLSGPRERLLSGWLANSLDRRALVFTSRRILLLHIDLRPRPLEVVSQLPYASITSAKAAWKGQCSVKLLNRETYRFKHVPQADRKPMIDFLTGLIHLTNAPFEHQRGVEHLCPHCFVFVPEHPSACPSCGGRFKSARAAGFLSLVIPGAGGWYLGQRSSAILELIGAGLLWYGLVISAGLRSALPWDGISGPKYWIAVGALLLLVHVTDGWLTHHFGRKGHFRSGEAPLRAGELPPFMNRPKPDLNSLNKLRLSRSNPPTEMGNG